MDLKNAVTANDGLNPLLEELQCPATQLRITGGSA
jgi:hypothetical protein